MEKAGAQRRLRTPCSPPSSCRTSEELGYTPVSFPPSCLPHSRVPAFLSWLCTSRTSVPTHRRSPGIHEGRDEISRPSTQQRGSHIGTKLQVTPCPQASSSPVSMGGGLPPGVQRAASRGGLGGSPGQALSGKGWIQDGQGPQLPQDWVTKGPWAGLGESEGGVQGDQAGRPTGRVWRGSLADSGSHSPELLSWSLRGGVRGNFV